MEQRIGPNIPPLQGAAVDPAFVPGITGPRPAGPGAAKPGEPAGEAASPETAEGEPSAVAAPADEDTPDEAPGTSGEPEESEESEETEASGEAGESPVPDGGPVFEASDRRAKAVADHSGVRLRLDDQEAEFRWDEIGAVETESPRFGRRFTITVHTPDSRWYPLEIEARSRSDFKVWEADLDKVLDAYFEEAEEARESAP